MTPKTRRRGQPVAVLVLLLGGWVALRGAFWDMPFAERASEPPGTLPTIPPSAPARAPSVAGLAEAPVSQGASASGPAALAGRAFSTMPDPPPRSGFAAPPLLLGPAEPAAPGVAPPASAPYRPLAALAAAPAGGRWSADGWVLLRRDTATALTSGRGSYGRSQAGAVLRYSLAPSSPLRPLAYARVSQALGARESELALGLSARPIPALPLRAAAELRTMRAGGQTLLRPAAYAVTELPPLTLPLGFTGQAYGQIGYVGGKYASAFADDQVRAERPLARWGDAELALGGGAWGGAQKGAARLDIGPGAALQVRLGKTTSRVSLDWRFRVAGNAEPASGPALTISAGF